jgi:hypothetical protein
MGGVPWQRWHWALKAYKSVLLFYPVPVLVLVNPPDGSVIEG